MKSPREALSRFLKSCSQLCITSVNFPTDAALQAHLYMRNTHVGRSANFKLNSQRHRLLAETRQDIQQMTVDTIEEMIPELQQRINMVQNIAQVAFDETMPPNLKALRDHERRMQKTTDQQEQSPDTR